MASVLHGNANMLECIDHLRRNYTLDPGVRLWAGETLRDVADDLQFGSEVLRVWDIIDEAEPGPRLAPPASPSAPVAAPPPARGAIPRRPARRRCPDRDAVARPH
jgi:hypothetical protein